MYRAAESCENAIQKEIKRINILCDNCKVSNEDRLHMLEDAEKHAYDKFKRICARVNDMNKIIESFKEDKLKNYWYLITIAPDKDKWILPTFIQKVKELCERKVFLEWEYCFEQKGETELDIGLNYHSHIVCESKYLAMNILEKMKNLLPNCVIKIGNDKCKYLKFESDVTFAKNYIRGDKHKKSKEAAVLMDSVWRIKNNLHNLYQSKEMGIELIKDGVIVQF